MRTMSATLNAMADFWPLHTAIQNRFMELCQFTRGIVGFPTVHGIVVFLDSWLIRLDRTR